MKFSDKVRARLEGKLPKLVLALFLLQPLMDILSFWVGKWEFSNLPTLALRFGVLGVMLFCGFFLSRNKKAYYIAAGICAFLGIGHMVSCFIAGYQNIFTDLSNYIRVLQLPLTVLCLITFLKEDDNCYGAVKKGIVLNISIILAVQVIAILTGTEPHTYPDGSGFIGWFSNTNTQSSILTMIAPVAVVWLYQRKGFQSVWLWLVLLGSCLSMYFIGTRLCFAGIVAMCFGIGGSMMIIRLKNWKKACVFLLVGVVFIAALPMAPMTGHRSSHADEMALKQGWLEQQLAQSKENDKEYGKDPIFPTDDLNLTEEEEALVEKLTPVYEHYVSDLVSVLGVARTVDLFNYTTDIVEMTNTRDKKLMFAQVLMQYSPLTAQFFGIELDRFTAKGYIFDVENDFHGIYYLYGWMGLAAMVVFLAYFLFIIAKALVKNFKRYFTLEAAMWGIALIMCLGHCYFTASTLRRPSSSFYLAAVLAAVYYLVKLKKYNDTPEV